jgi:protein gp37
MEINQIKVAEPFVSAFRIRKENYDEIFRDMQINGYDPNEPVLLWSEANCLIDGHTRIKVAKDLKIDDVPVSMLSFKDESEAIKYATKRNNNKGRKTTKGDKLRLVRILDEVWERGGNNNPEGLGGFGKRNTIQSKGQICPIDYDEDSTEAKSSAEITGKIIGIAGTYVKRMRTVLAYCNNSDVEDVENDKLTLEDAWKRAKENKAKIEAELNAVKQFNFTNDNIKWAKWTWNPVTGCKHGCDYCYANEMANRFPDKFYNFEPHFYPERLSAPENTNIPEDKKDLEGINNVFVVSMGDLFGEWVPNEWIEAVFDSISKTTKPWNFLLLTKNPERYLKLDIPLNCHIGSTATNQIQMNRTLTVFKELRKNGITNTLFISCEPLMGKVEIPDGSSKYIDWIIIGGRSRTANLPAGQPDWRLVADLFCKTYNQGIKPYFKTNLTFHPEEYPESLK